jgi:hypothetical protein
MPVAAVALHDLVLAVHILGAVAGFGIVFGFPLLLAYAGRAEPAVLPWLLRARRRAGRLLVNPGLTVVVAAGIYLATDEHQWSNFYVGWGIVAAVVIGALEGSIIIRRLGPMAERAQRDLAATAVPGGGQRTSAVWSPEYVADLRVVRRAGWAIVAIVVVTVFLMATHAGA